MQRIAAQPAAVAAAAVQRIIALAALHQVVAAAAVQRVVAAQAQDGVVVAGAGQVVVAGGAGHQQARAIGRIALGEIGRGQVASSLAVQHQNRAPAAIPQRVHLKVGVACAVVGQAQVAIEERVVEIGQAVPVAQHRQQRRQVQHIAARAGLEVGDVVGRSGDVVPTDEVKRGQAVGVVAATAAERIAAAIPIGDVEDQVVAGAALHSHRGGRVPIARPGAGAEVDAVIAIAAIQQAAGAGAGQAVIAGLAVEAVLAGAAGQCVVAGIAVQHAAALRGRGAVGGQAAVFDDVAGEVASVHVDPVVGIVPQGGIVLGAPSLRLAGAPVRIARLHRCALVEEGGAGFRPGHPLPIALMPIVAGADPAAIGDADIGVDEGLFIGRGDGDEVALQAAELHRRCRGGGVPPGHVGVHVLVVVAIGRVEGQRRDAVRGQHVVAGAAAHAVEAAAYQRVVAGIAQ